mgnify:CR=1 FL=1
MLGAAGVSRSCVACDGGRKVRWCGCRFTFTVYPLFFGIVSVIGWFEGVGENLGGLGEGNWASLWSWRCDLDTAHLVLEFPAYYCDSKEHDPIPIPHPPFPALVIPCRPPLWRCGGRSPNGPNAAPRPTLPLATPWRIYGMGVWSRGGAAAGGGG